MLQYWLVVAFTLGGGAFSLAGSVRNWEWFFENRRSARFVRVVGRTGARAIYAAIGLGLMSFGLLLLVVGPSMLPQ